MSAPNGFLGWWQRYLLAGWQRRNGLTYLLLPLSYLFAILSACRRAWFARRGQQVLPVPVLVVGNIFIGGTGKTPFVIWLVEVLRAAGFTPGVISRGYGGQTQSGVQVLTATSLASEVGDEPLLIARRSACPVAIGRSRVEVARTLLERFPQVDIVISDDGLQHYALPRQFECVLFDQRACGNGHLLPAGPLREAPTRRRDVSIFNLSSELEPQQWQALLQSTGALAAHSYVMRLQPGKFWQLCQPEQRCDMPTMLQRGATLGTRPTVLAAAGIGNPERFFASLSQAGLQFDRLALPDHYDFAVNPFATSTHALILITEKDAVKCASHASLQRDPRIWVLPVEAQLDAALAQYIVEKCRGCTLT